MRGGPDASAPGPLAPLRRFEAASLRVEAQQRACATPESRVLSRQAGAGHRPRRIPPQPKTSVHMLITGHVDSRIKA